MESEEASSSSTAAPRAGNQSQPDPESGKEKKKTYEEIACRCTNFRFRVHYPGGEEGSTIAGIASGSSKARENVIVELERDEERGESVVHLVSAKPKARRKDGCKLMKMMSAMDTGATAASIAA